MAEEKKARICRAERITGQWSAQRMSFNSPDALDRHRRKLPEPITKTTRRNPAEQLSVLASQG